MAEKRYLLKNGCLIYGEYKSLNRAKRALGCYMVSDIVTCGRVRGDWKIEEV